MKHKVKVAVIDKKLYPKLQRECCANPNAGACGCYNVGDEFMFYRADGRDDFWHMGAGTLAKTAAGHPKQRLAAAPGNSGKITFLSVLSIKKCEKKSSRYRELFSAVFSRPASRARACSHMLSTRILERIIVRFKAENRRVACNSHVPGVLQEFSTRKMVKICPKGAANAYVNMP